MSTRVELTGMNELMSKLDKLKDGVKKNYVDKALEEGAKPILDEMKANCPVSPWSPHAREYLDISPAKTIDGLRTVEVGIDKSDMSDAFYLKFAEWGWTIPYERVMGKKSGHAYIRKIRSGGNKVAARPFLEPAFNAKKEEALEKIASVLKEELEND